LETGTLVAGSVSIQNGGQLSGNGTVAAKLVVADGNVSPGFTIGHLNVEGSYEQQSNGTLLFDISGASSNQFDTMDVTGDVQLGGTLRLDTSDFTASPPGTTIEVISASSLAGTFEAVVSTGNDDIYFHPLYDYVEGVVRLELLDRGDMNGDQIINSADHDLFVFGLMNKESMFYAQCQCSVGPQQGGDFNGNGSLDFDDIPGFRTKLAGMGTSPKALDAAFDRYFSTVPEPSSALLMLFGLSGFCCRSDNIRARRWLAARRSG
jgi:hypothetical protein